MSGEKYTKKQILDMAMNFADVGIKSEGHDKCGILIFSFPLDGDDTELNFSSNMCEHHTLEKLESILKKIRRKIKNV